MLSMILRLRAPSTNSGFILDLRQRTRNSNLWNSHQTAQEGLYLFYFQKFRHDIAIKQLGFFYGFRCFRQLVDLTLFPWVSPLRLSFACAGGRTPDGPRGHRGFAGAVSSPRGAQGLLQSGGPWWGMETPKYGPMKSMKSMESMESYIMFVASLYIF